MVLNSQISLPFNFLKRSLSITYLLLLILNMIFSFTFSFQELRKSITSSEYMILNLGCSNIFFAFNVTKIHKRLYICKQKQIIYSFLIERMYVTMEILYDYFIIPLSVSRRFILFSADLCLLPLLSRHEIFKDIRLPLAFE